MFSKIKSWWIELIYGSKEEQEHLLIEDRQGDFYCKPCFNIIYDPDVRYEEGVGFFKIFR